MTTTLCVRSLCVKAMGCAASWVKEVKQQLFVLCFLVKDGVVLGADTRATEGMVVADKNCSKIHYISPNI